MMFADYVKRKFYKIVIESSTMYRSICLALNKKEKIIFNKFAKVDVVRWD